jgi:hypothetical protein
MHASHRMRAFVSFLLLASTVANNQRFEVG